MLTLSIPTGKGQFVPPYHMFGYIGKNARKYEPPENNSIDFAQSRPITVSFLIRTSVQWISQFTVKLDRLAHHDFGKEQ